MSREFIVRLLEVVKVWQESQVSGAGVGSLFISFVARERIKLIIEASDDWALVTLANSLDRLTEYR